MNFENHKTEWLVAGLMAVLVGGLFQLFGSMWKTSDLREQNMSYEMPRPKSDLVGEFDLDGREIDRQYINPFAKKEAEDKAKAAKAAAPNATAKKAAAAAKKVATQKVAPQTNIQIVGDEDGSGLTDQGARSGVQRVSFNREISGAGAGDEETPPTNEDKLSPGQWKALLLAEPTRDNMAKLTQALLVGDVDQEVFYEILDALMKSQKAEDHVVAFQGLSAVPNGRSFAFVVVHMDSLPSESRSLGEQFLLSYTAAPRLGSLAQALQSSNVEVALKAAEIVLIGAQRVQDGSQTNNPREARGEIRVQSIQAYALFIPIFERWAQSGDNQLQQIASNALSQLEAARPEESAS